jgi:hypothetical protein
MLKHLTALLLISFVLALAGIAYLGSQAPSYKGCQTVTRQQEAKDKTADSYEVATSQFFRCQGVFLDQNNGTITGIATALLAVVTIGLVLLAGEQSKTARAELRAYVSARPEHISSFDGTHRPKIIIKLFNHGQTPARKLRHRIEVGLLPNPLRPGLSLPEPLSAFSNPTTLFPGVEVNGSKSRENAFTAGELADIRNESVRIYVYGEVEYFDVFGDCWITTFCSGMQADAPTLKKLTSNYLKPDLSVTFEIAPMGNDTCRRTRRIRMEKH